jgi:hypothetical protein
MEYVVKNVTAVTIFAYTYRLKSTMPYDRIAS